MVGEGKQQQQRKHKKEVTRGTEEESERERERESRRSERGRPWKRRSKRAANAQVSHKEARTPHTHTHVTNDILQRFCLQGGKQTGKGITIKTKHVSQNNRLQTQSDAVAHAHLRTRKQQCKAAMVRRGGRKCVLTEYATKEINNPEAMANTIEKMSSPHQKGDKKGSSTKDKFSLFSPFSRLFDCCNEERQEETTQNKQAQLNGASYSLACSLSSVRGGEGSVQDA